MIYMGKKFIDGINHFYQSVPSYVNITLIGCIIMPLL